MTKPIHQEVVIKASPKRVYEVLAQKVQLFDGVFGASDEVLGAVESGVDFERRIAEIYQTCRHPEAIHTAFEQLQLDLAGEISDAMLNARKSLLENFDEDVQERLRLRNQDARASLGRLERLLMRFTRAARPRNSRRRAKTGTRRLYIQRRSLKEYKKYRPSFAKTRSLISCW